MFGPQLKVHSGIVFGLNTRSFPTTAVIQDTAYTALFWTAVSIKATNWRQN